MKKTLPFLLFLCLFCNLSFAQFENTDSSKLRLIYLDDGQKLIGKMVNFTPNYLVLEENGSTDEVYFEEIVSMKRITTKDLNYHYLNKGRHYKTNGFFNHTKGGYLSGSNAEGNFVHTINGFYLNQKLAVGLGIGREKYEESNVSDSGKFIHTFLPVYAQVRYYLFDFQISPYITLAGGYGLPLYSEQYEKENFKGGMWYHPTLGFRFASKLKTNLIIEVGYINQDASGEFLATNQTMPTIRDFTLNGFTVSGGLLF